MRIAVLLCLTISLHGQTTVRQPIQSFTSAPHRNKTPDNTTNGQKDKEFVVLFTPSFNESTHAHLIVTSEETGHSTLKVDIESQYPGKFISSNPFDNVVIIELPNSLVDISDGINTNAIKVKSDHSISVVGVLGLGTYATEAFSVLSVEKLGTKYNLATVQPFNTINEQFGTFGMVSVNDNTDVTIRCENSNITLHRTNLTIQQGTNYSLTLQYLESFYFEVQSDITGSIIESNKPIAVFQGTKQTGRSYNYQSGKYADGIQRFDIEQMIPSDSMGNEFIVPNLMYASSVEADIVPQNSESKIYSYTENELTVYEKKDLHKISVSSKSPTSIASTTTMQINLRVKMYKNQRTSYFKVTLPPLSQFSNYSVLCAPLGNETYDNYVTIIIKETEVDGIRFDGHPVTPLMDSSINYENELYKILHLRISSIRSHTITHVSPNVNFGAIVYGIGDGYSYGYSSGLQN